MKKTMILLAFPLAATGALAGNTTTEPASGQVQAKQMTDADLDEVTAGAFNPTPGNSLVVQIVRTPEGMTVTNPGNASVYIQHKRGSTCINDGRCAPPPPPLGGPGF